MTGVRRGFISEDHADTVTKSPCMRRGDLRYFTVRSDVICDSTHGDHNTEHVLVYSDSYSAAFIAASSLLPSVLKTLRAFRQAGWQG